MFDLRVDIEYSSKMENMKAEFQKNFNNFKIPSNYISEAEDHLKM